MKSRTHLKIPPFGKGGDFLIEGFTMLNPYLL